MNTTRRAYFDDITVNITTDETFSDLDMIRNGSTMSANEGATVEKKKTLNDANSETDTVSLNDTNSEIDTVSLNDAISESDTVSLVVAAKVYNSLNDAKSESDTVSAATELTSLEEGSLNQLDIETNGKTWLAGGLQGDIGTDLSTSERPHGSQMWTKSQPNTARNVRKSMNYPSVDSAESENESKDQLRSTVSPTFDSEDSEEERIYLEALRRRRERKDAARRHKRSKSKDDARRDDRSKSRGRRKSRSVR
jgi:hypothetical protein